MRKYCLVVAVLIVSNSIYAQKPSFGLKAGANFSNIRIANNSSTDYKVGLHIGGLAHMHLSPRWALQPELVYSGQGGERTYLNTKVKTSLNYINLPILVQRMFGNGFRLQAGPQLGFLLNAESESGNIETDVSGSYKSIDVSFPIGLGYLTSSSIGFDLRWVPGLTDIQESGVSMGNNSFQLGLFYQLGNNGHKHKK